MANAGAGLPAARPEQKSRGGSVRGRRVKIAIGMASVVIVVLFACANFMVLDYAVRSANDFVAQTEKTLVKNEFRNQIEQVVLYQSGMSVWDKSFDELADGSFSNDFIRRDLRHWLWRDSGFSWMVFSRPNGEILLAMRDGHVVIPAEAKGLLYWISDLSSRATTSYFSALRRTRDGWIVEKPGTGGDLLAPAVPQISATGMRMIDGAMSIVVVQSVVPRRLFVPDERREPVLMTTVKPITAEMLAKSEQRLGLSNLGFSPITTEDDSLLMTGVGGDAFNPMVASWRPNRPGSFVWSMAVPQIGALVAMFVVVMGFGASKFSALVRALERSEKRNAYLARHDTLTCVMNRSGFDEAVNAQMRREREPFSIVAIDLDRFKEVNDRHGHAAGDEVLKVIAARFSARVGDGGRIARLGGDEFVVLLPGIANRRAVLELADGLVRDAQIPIPFNGQILSVGGSAGAAAFPEHGQTVHAIMMVADAALYAAKNGGRNRAQYGTAGEPGKDTEAA